MTEKLGPASRALLDVVNETFGFVQLFDTLIEASMRTSVYHAEMWWWRRLVALALEGRIEAQVFRDGDDVTIQFRRLREGEG